MSLTILMLLACGGSAEQAPSYAPMEAEKKSAPGWGGGDGDDFGALGYLEEEDAMDEAYEPEPEMAEAPKAAPMKSKEEGRVGRGEDKDRGEGQSAPEDAAPTRSWFPETFLWEPAVVTDASGTATVHVTVPDTLTSWRVVGLAASRDGAQAGATHSFSSTLPVLSPRRILRLPFSIILMASFRFPLNNPPSSPVRPTAFIPFLRMVSTMVLLTLPEYTIFSTSSVCSSVTRLTWPETEVTKCGGTPSFSETIFISCEPPWTRM